MCFLVRTLTWLLKTVVKVFSFFLYVGTYFDRIQELLFSQFVIETLSESLLVGLQKAEKKDKRLADLMQKL